MYTIEERSALEKAAQIIESKITYNAVFSSPKDVSQYCQYNLLHYEHEVFFVLFLNHKHQLITACEMFRGSISGASIYPREVVKEALLQNASAVILAHNHPSGDPEPSQADITITNRLCEALSLMDIRVLDHLVVGNQGSVSLAERGLL
ncbi:MAG: DNA repair protein RadC [Neptuniibacter sp.]